MRVASQHYSSSRSGGIARAQTHAHGRVHSTVSLHLVPDHILHSVQQFLHGGLQGRGSARRRAHDHPVSTNYIHACMYICVHSQTHTRARILVHEHTHDQHTHTHTHTQKCIYTQPTHMINTHTLSNRYWLANFHILLLLPPTQRPGHKNVHMITHPCTH